MTTYAPSEAGIQRCREMGESTVMTDSYFALRGRPVDNKKKEAEDQNS
jgi:hypothetical protein